MASRWNFNRLSSEPHHMSKEPHVHFNAEAVRSDNDLFTLKTCDPESSAV